MTGFPHHSQIRKVLADFLVQEDTNKLGADDEAIEKLDAIYRERFLELINSCLPFNTMSGVNTIVVAELSQKIKEAL